MSNNCTTIRKIGKPTDFVEDINVTKIEDLEKNKIKGSVTICGIVKNVGEVELKECRNGSEITLRKILLADETGKK